MAFNFVALLTVIVFYVAILFTGLWFGWRRRQSRAGAADDADPRRRDVGPVIALLEMTVFWLSLSLINGSAEIVFSAGLLNCLVLVGFAFSLVVGAFLVTPAMKRNGYDTLLVPLKSKYGAWAAGLLLVPTLLGQLVWSTALISAVASTVHVVNGFEMMIALVLVCVAVLSPSVNFCCGSRYSFAHRNLIETVFIVFALAVTLPFVFQSQAVPGNWLTDGKWLGSLCAYDVGPLTDTVLMAMLGGVTWQACLDRILVVRNSTTARVMSLAAAFGCLLLFVPVLLVGGAVGYVNATALALKNDFHSDMILPAAIFSLSPRWSSILGLGAFVAAGLSSVDSCLLRLSYTLADCMNVLKKWERLVHIGLIAAASLLALAVRSPIDMVLLSVDLAFVLLFPQVVLILHWNRHCTIYGSLSGFFVGLLFRLLGGEPMLNLPAVLVFPFYDGASGFQQFPFKTLCMLISLVTHMIVSLLTNRLCKKKCAPTEFDLTVRRPDSPSVSPTPDGPKKDAAANESQWVII